MTRQLAHHHQPPNPCPVCEAILAELAAVRLALLNAETERDAAQQEAGRMPHPRYSATELDAAAAFVPTNPIVIDEWVHA
jgi:hypothetical protein